MLDKKSVRYINTPVKKPPTGYYAPLEDVAPTGIVFGSVSNSHFIDVVSLGPVGGIEAVYLDEALLSREEFPNSTVYFHDGAGASSPWAGSFPYAERTLALGKQVEVTQWGEGVWTSEVINRSVSSLGVKGLRVNFTTAGFTHTDHKNRVKWASARFSVTILDENGSPVGFASSPYTRFSARNPTSLQVFVAAPAGLEDRIWDYRITAEIMGHQHQSYVTGTWSVSTVTELYAETQRYDKIAFASGTIVAADTSGKIPKRQYLMSGYKVRVPVYQNVGGVDVLTGEFTNNVSDSHAWNALAVLTDSLWGGDLPLDKVDLASFEEFHKYCQKVVGGEKRYSYSQYLIKADNYYKIASEIVGAADGKLYEDTSGRIGVFVDKQVNNRRVITSYDIVSEKVKRVTVSDNKKINSIEAEFEDSANLYKNTLLHDYNQDAINLYGVVVEKIKLDTCTRESEAKRVMKRMLLTSQLTTTAYTFKVGHAHEDIQIGEVVELYDRIYSRVNYCGKTLEEGTTASVIKIDPRTPIDLTGITNPMITLDNGREIPTRRYIQSWTSSEIVLSSPLTSAPDGFTSFGVTSGEVYGLKPTLIRVMGVDDSEGVLSIEGVEYNDSLYSHIDNGTNLVIPVTQYLPAPAQVDILELTMGLQVQGLVASWAGLGAAYEYGYSWERVPLGDTVSTVVKTGTVTAATTTLSKPLEEGLYTFRVFPVLSGEQVGDKVSATITLLATVGSPLPSPSNFVTVGGEAGTQYTGREFTVSWEQGTSTGATLSHFKLRVEQGGVIKELILGADVREHRFSEVYLSNNFGVYQRSFNLEILAVDTNLTQTSGTPLSITEVEPPSPVITDLVIGGITLGYSPSIPSDVVSAKLSFWEGSNISGEIPPSAEVLTSSLPSSIQIPLEYLQLDGRYYVFDVVWVDAFGESTNHTRQVAFFDPSLIVPEIPDLTEVVPVDSQSVLINFSHNGEYLKNIKASYRKLGLDTWNELGEVFEVPPVGSNNGYDQETDTGFVRVSGLVRNFTYEFRLRVANTNSPYSEWSEVVTGSPYLDVLLPEDIPDLSDILINLDLSDPRSLIVEGVSDVFGEAENKASIVKTQQVIATETTARVTEINSLTAEVQSNKANITTAQQAIATETTARVTEINSLTAEVQSNKANITTAQQAIATETTARVTEINSLTAEVQSNKANITTAQQAIATETTARSTAIQQLTAVVGGNTATITNTQDALATETNARVVAVSELTAVVGSNTAGITSANQAIVSETNARVSSIQQLTAQVGSDIALVDASAKAAIGYCTIGGGTSSHETKALCQSAGGTWTDSTLATATRTVQVSSGVNTATVGSFYSSFVDLQGEVTGKAVLGVDVNGAFTGMEVVGGNNYSQMTFKGNTIKFQNAAGVDQLVYDDTTNTWKFTGAIYAEKILGDIVEVSVLNISSQVFTEATTGGSSKKIATFTIAPASFSKTVIVGTMQLTMGYQSALVLEAHLGNVDPDSSTPYTSQLVRTSILDSAIYEQYTFVNSLPMIFTTVPNQPLVITLALSNKSTPSGWRTVGYTPVGGATTVTLAKKGNSFSQQA
jgi:hypothetical protein